MDLAENGHDFANGRVRSHRGNTWFDDVLAGGGSTPEGLEGRRHCRSVTALADRLDRGHLLRLNGAVDLEDLDRLGRYDVSVHPHHHALARLACSRLLVSSIG